ncbi:hypothetical protein E2P81_ATG10674 [Venturia nashicola]|nr:hypothetical protein E2P81_ATG10674 [Venturia nashicola]
MSTSNKPKRTYSAYVEGASKMHREITADWNGSSVPNWKNNHSDTDNNSIPMGRTTPRNTNVRTMLLPAPRHPRTANGKYPHSHNSRDEGDNVQEMGFYDRSLLTSRSAPMQRGHKTTGGVRLVPTPTNETFPAFEDDKEMLDVQTAGPFFATLQSSFQTPRARGDTNASQTSRIDHDEMSAFPSFTLPARQEEHTDGLPPTRQQVLTLMEAEINAFNTKSRAKSKDRHFVPFDAPNLLSKVKNSKYEDLPSSVVGEGYDGINVEGQVTNLDEVVEYEGGRENEKRKWKNKKKEMIGSTSRTPTHTPTGRTTRSQPRFAITRVSSLLKKARVPRPSAPEAATEVQAAETKVDELVVLQPYRPNSLINLLSLLQTHLDAFPALYVEYPTLRTQPWDILGLREKLPPIEWNASFRLKLDIFVNCMDWVGLGKSGEIDRKSIVGWVKGVVEDMFERQNLLRPKKAAELEDGDVVLVVVRTIRLERVIDVLREKFAGMEQAEREKERSKIKGMEWATYLLTWLWFLEAVPDEALSSVDVERVGRVFRTTDDWAVVPSGPVVLMGD